MLEKKKIKHRKFVKKFENLNINQRNNKLIILSNKSENELIKDKSLYNNEYNFSFKEINNYNKNSTIVRNRNNNERKDKNKSIKPLNNKLNKNEKSFYGEFKLLEHEKKYKKKKFYSKYIFPIYYYFLDIIFDNLINPKKFFCISKTYFIIYNYMCKIYDISTYIIIFKHYNIINNMFKENAFEDKEYYPLNIIKKINISDVKLIERMNKDLREKKSILYSNYL